MTDEEKGPAVGSGEAHAAQEAPKVVREDSRTELPAREDVHRGRYLGKKGSRPRIEDYTVRVDFGRGMTTVDYIAHGLIRQPPLTIPCPVTDGPPHDLTLRCLAHTRRPRLSLVCEAGHRPEQIAPLLRSSMIPWRAP